MFFARDDEGREVLREALRNRDPQVSPIETLRLLAHGLITERRPFVEFSTISQGSVETVQASETLMAWARAISDELAAVAVCALAETAGRACGEPDARFAAALLLTT